MWVTDASGRRWLIARRFAPWRPVIQPLNLCRGEYRRYRAAPVARPRKHLTGRRADSDSGIVEKVIETVLVVIMAPWLIFNLLFFLVLLPVAAVEALLGAALGAVLWAVRRTGLMRTRIDVVAAYPNQWGFPSLTVLAVPGPGNADVLERGLRALLDKGPRAFDPHGDPAAQRLVAQTRAEIVRHASYLVRAR
jgi:hypothetical protein